MKRIKHEGIQHSIQNYVRQRNLNPTKTTTTSSSSNSANRKHSLLTTTTATTPQMDSSSADANPSEQSLADLSLACLNDLVLIESSISDYYAYSFNSSSDQDYLNQFEK